MTSNSYRRRIATLNGIPRGYSLPGYPAPAYWNVYALNPFFSGFGFYGDPFDSAFPSGGGCFGFASFGFAPFGSWNFDPYAAEFASPPFFGSFLGPDFFCGGPFSSTFFGSSFGGFGPTCAFCGAGAFSPFGFGWNSSFPYAFTLYSPTPIAFTSGPLSGSLTGLIASSASESSVSADSYSGNVAAPRFGSPVAGAGLSADVSAAPPLSNSVFATSQPPDGQTLTLVLANGSKVKATKYWLTGDGELHYVTASGNENAVPFSQFDMAATMKANRQSGVRFLAPPSSESQPALGQQ